MFDRYIIEDNSLEAAARVTAEMELDRESRERIAREEIKARDRVNITLEEYESMKREIKSLTASNNEYKRKFILFKDILWLKIDPDTLRFETCDLMQPNRKSKCKIEFEFLRTPEYMKKW